MVLVRHDNVPKTEEQLGIRASDCRRGIGTRDITYFVLVRHPFLSSISPLRLDTDTSFYMVQ